jgi:hypothetical protein
MLSEIGGGHVRHVLMTVVVVWVMSVSLPAWAQRPARRFRAYQPAPRVAAPVRPAAPRATPQPAAASPALPATERPKPAPATQPPAKKEKEERPQTTATGAAAEAPQAPVADDWGQVPFGEEWRQLHSEAWRAGHSSDRAVVVAGGSQQAPTRDGRPAELAHWLGEISSPAPKPQPVARSVLQSVLQVSGEAPPLESPSSTPSANPEELFILPGADGSIPANPATAERAATDGTVSVLVRPGKTPAGDEGGQRPGLDATPERDDSNADDSSPWLPLGAFAVLPAGSGDHATPHIFIELCLHRDGTVRGNYFDAVSDAVHPIEGRYRREGGTLTWKIGPDGAEFETTADELTAGRVEATVRRGPSTRTWTLIGLP